MNHEEACQVARQMNSQGIAIEDIRKHLHGVGYVSERTKKPVTWATIRYMIHKDDVKKKTMAKADAKQERREARKADKVDAIKLVAGPDREVINHLKGILATNALPMATRYKMMELLLKTS